MILVSREELPKLFPVISSCYSGQSFLRFGKYTLMSDEGLQLGDPIGPLLFCLTTMAFVIQVKSQRNIWYTDDGAMGANVDTLLSDFRMLIDECKRLGLIINVAKCEISTDNVEVMQKF
jgi:Reverse transcriptase (RNA-dependent DNA polymerase)